MPTANFGEKVSFSTNRFTKLTAKGDKVQFRIIKAPFYDGKHFLKDDEGNWDIRPCPRINEGHECEFCNKFFAALKKAKKEGLDQKETDKLTNPWKASVSFYYPIINRESGEFEIFQTTKGVRDAIEAELELNSKTLERDIIVLRTEIPGSYYKVSVVDSADIKKLTKEEKEAFDKGKEIDLSEFVYGVEDDEGEVALEANTEVADEQAQDF